MFLHLFNKQPPDFSTSKFTRLQNNDPRLSMVHFSTVKTLDFFDVWIGVRSSRFAKLKYDLRSRTGLNTIEVIDLRRLLKYSVSVNKFPSQPPSPPTSEKSDAFCNIYAISEKWYILVINDNLLILSEEIIWQKGKSIIHNKLVSKKLWKELIIDIDILQRC